MEHATKLPADNSYDTMEIVGLKEGTYYIQEIEAPSGYQLPDNAFMATISAVNNGYSGQPSGDTPGNKYSIVLATNGNKESITEPIGSEAEGANVFFTAMIENGTSKAMPSTGGAGTIALIAVGALVFLCTGVVLVTKKRMYNAG